VLTSLDHIVLAVRDLARATDTYRKLLGREPSWRGRHEAYGTANTLFRLENTYLELLATAGDGPLAAQVEGWLAEHGEGPLALAFATDDVEAAVRTLRARGLAASDPADGIGRDERTGAERRWRNVFLPPSGTRGVMTIVIEHRSPPDALPAAVPVAGVEAAVAACDHVVVRSSDADASRALYGDVFGLRLALDRRFEDWGVRLLFFRTGHLTVELAASLAQSDPAAPDHFWGISWRVPDLVAAHARLAAAGFDVSDIRAGRRPGTRVVTVRAETHGVATLVIGHEDARDRRR
jgi:catechol 2,3-dioxygenase-like lactoylglutathione lyase family enzyme